MGLQIVIHNDAISGYPDRDQNREENYYFIQWMILKIIDPILSYFSTSDPNHRFFYRGFRISSSAPINEFCSEKMNFFWTHSVLGHFKFEIQQKTLNFKSTYKSSTANLYIMYCSTLVMYTLVKYNVFLSRVILRITIFCYDWLLSNNSLYPALQKSF